jgi:Zn-dependent peptidase ImmA (M78 family)
LGHLILAHNTGELHVDKGIVLFRDADLASGGECEAEANRFAAELLIPKAFLQSDLSKLNAFDVITDENLDYLAARYSVSMAAIVNRLRVVGFSDVTA